MKILILDNYDSFTYNLVQIIRELSGTQPDVYRNDRISLQKVNEYDKILLSPGPGIPEEAGLLKEIIRTYAATKSILGVCLGHQAIGEVFGAELINMEEVYHGIASQICLTDSKDSLFEGIQKEFSVGRYHSWLVSPRSFPKELMITSMDEDGQIMSMKHRSLDVKGVQFHPESVLTPDGVTILKNWVKH